MPTDADRLPDARSTFFHTWAGRLTAFSAGLVAGLGTLYAAHNAPRILASFDKGGASFATAVPPPAPGDPVRAVLQPAGSATRSAGSGTGAVAKRALTTRFPPQLGDLGREGEVRAFVTFDLSELPEGEMATAKLYVTQQPGGRPLDPRFFAVVRVETVDIGAVLTTASFDTRAVQIAQVPAVRLSAVPLDVTEAVATARARPSPRVTFRLRFLSRGDDDAEPDTLTLVIGGASATRLEVDVAQ